MLHDKMKVVGYLWCRFRGCLKTICLCIIITCDVEDLLGGIAEDSGGLAALAECGQHGSVPGIIHNLFSLFRVVSAFHCYLHLYSKRVG